MTLHYYFLPVLRVTNNDRIHRGPKYLKWTHNQDGEQVKWSMIDCGLFSTAFVACDSNITQHQTLFDYPDVLSIDPRNGNQRNLNANATDAEINALVNYLDTPGNFIPLGWATTADTRREILRGICGIFLFIQRATAVSRLSPDQWGVTMNTTWVELTDQQRQWIRDAASSLGFGASDPPDEMTIRHILRYMGNHWGQRPIYMGSLGQL